ncbi:hypothetical protein [Rhizobium oryzicola]|uniref:Uncharacterized protein n=1 Tax=Rhizobium oryzicola TaxID=1232668 RepID=A0ABT8SQ26_9HYPH|nr:hypothetical protein [Rhizobium oryzicola]MDO1580589.1 hypothetical protein [Rhizobium oryzicola]
MEAAPMEVVMRTQVVRRPVHPHQLSLLQQVFDEACARYNIDKDSPDGEALALILVNSLQKGMSEREALAHLATALADNI